MTTEILIGYDSVEGQQDLLDARQYTIEQALGRFFSAPLPSKVWFRPLGNMVDLLTLTSLLGYVGPDVSVFMKFVWTYKVYRETGSRWAFQDFPLSIYDFTLTLQENLAKRPYSFEEHLTSFQFILDQVNYSVEDTSGLLGNPIVTGSKGFACFDLGSTSLTLEHKRNFFRRGFFRGCLVSRMGAGSHYCLLKKTSLVPFDLSAALHLSKTLEASLGETTFENVWSGDSLEVNGVRSKVTFDHMLEILLRV